jgi:hypothetical protein
MHKFLLKYLCPLHWSFMMSLQKVKDVCNEHLTFRMMQILSTFDESYNVMTKIDHPYPMIFPNNPSKCFYQQVPLVIWNNILVYPPYIVWVLIYTMYFDIRKWFCLYHEIFTSRIVFDTWKDFHVGGIIQSFSWFGNQTHLPKWDFFLKASINGMESFLELIGDKMKSHLFIDILVKSSKSKSKTFQFIHEHVLSQIEHLCNVVQVGCEGVALVREILNHKLFKTSCCTKIKETQQCWWRSWNKSYSEQTLIYHMFIHRQKCQMWMKAMLTSLVNVWWTL